MRKPGSGRLAQCYAVEGRAGPDEVHPCRRRAHSRPGLPPQAGLYTLVASMLIYALLGTSRHLAVAATSASAALLASSVVAVMAATAADASDASAYAAYAATFVLVTGLVFLAAGLARLGFITQSLSKPVMDGFVVGMTVSPPIRPTQCSPYFHPDMVSDVVVELMDPVLEGHELTYKVAILDGEMPAEGGPSALSFDVIGRPATPVSAAGMHRRRRRRR